jgi:hypothetical protein
MRPHNYSPGSLPALLALFGLACSTGPDVPGPPALLVLTKAPSGWQQSGVPFARPPVIQLADADGNAVEQAGTVITAAITSGGGTLGGATALATADTGMVVFEDLSIAGTVGEKILTFSAPGLLSATSTLNLTAGPAGTILVHQGDNQSAAPGAVVGTAPSVQVTDADENPVSGVAVTFEVTAGSGSITGPTQITDGAGIAAVGSWTLGSTVGTNTLTARADGLTGSAITFTASGVAEPAAGAGCFVDDLGRTYCADPGPPVLPTVATHQHPPPGSPYRSSPVGMLHRL